MSKIVNCQFGKPSDPFKKRSIAEQHTPTEGNPQLNFKNLSQKFFCFKPIFLSGLNRKFHMYFTADKVFERPV